MTKQVLRCIFTSGNMYDADWPDGETFQQLALMTRAAGYFINENSMVNMDHVQLVLKLNVADEVKIISEGNETSQ